MAKKPLADENPAPQTGPETPAPAEPAAAAAESKRLAEHGYIDANGAVVEDIEKATGISYKDKGTGETFSYNFAEHGGTAGAVATMFAVFGAKTRATNAASAARQKRARDSAYVQSDVAYIVEVFGETKPDVWAAAGEGSSRAPAIDLAMLQAAIAEYAESKGQSLDPLKLQEKLAGDLAYRRGAFGNPDVKKIYLRLAGKPESTVDLFAL